MAIMCWKPRMAAGMKAIFSSSGKNVGGGRVFTCRRQREGRSADRQAAQRGSAAQAAQVQRHAQRAQRRQTKSVQACAGGAARDSRRRKRAALLRRVL